MASHSAGSGASTGFGLVHVVDDEDAVRRSLEFLLRTAGYQVKQWDNGTDFLRRADKGIFACVLLDIRMPGIDGLEVQKRMAHHGLDFPVIMLTGHGDVPQAVQAMQLGAADFMEKPIDPEKLLRSVAAAFERLADHASARDEQAWACSQVAKLTDRERQVLAGLASGYPNKIIADRLGISTRTVEVHRAHTMAKLQAGNYADLLRIAVSAGLGTDFVRHAGRTVDREAGAK